MRRKSSIKLIRCHFRHNIYATTNMKTTIIIPLYNPNIEFLLKTLEFIIQDSKNLLDRIILVDDGSPEIFSKHSEQIKTIWENIEIVRELNKGPGGARNQGAKYARTDVIVFLDQDCRPHSGWLMNLVRPIEEGNFVATMGRIESFASKSRIALFADYIELLRYAKKDKNNLFKILISANFAIKNDVFREIGGFDERLNVAGEDLDLTFRLNHKGYGQKLAFIENALVYHAHRNTLKKFFQQQFGYGFGTMFHCLLRSRQTTELGFHTPSIGIILINIFEFSGKSLKTIFTVPVKKYGILNKLIYFPLFEYIKQCALLCGHVKAVKEFDNIRKKMEAVDVRNTVKIILENDDGEFLILRRPDGAYGLAGGGIKRGETKEQALERECGEELGISTKHIKNLIYLGKQHTIGRINYHFIADVFRGKLTADTAKNIRLSEEHDTFLWRELADAPFPLNITLEETLKHDFTPS